MIAMTDMCPTTSPESCPRSDDARVAVVIPVYRAHFLGEALDSVFAQTRQPDEVIVVDDGSPDQWELDAAVSRYHDRVSVLRQPNKGAGYARNLGIAATSAPFIALLDADDRWMPNFLAEQLPLVAGTPGADLVYSDGVIIGRSSLAGQRFMKSCPSVGEVTLQSLLAQRCTVLLSAVVARRSAMLACGGFDGTLRRGQDFDLWLRMAWHGSRFRYQRKVLVERRIHTANLSGTSADEQERPLSVLEKTLRTLPLNAAERRTIERRMRELRAALARELGKELLKQGKYRAARREFARADAAVPAWKLHATLVGLVIAPRLVRSIYLSRAEAAQRGPRQLLARSVTGAGGERDR